MAEPSPFLSVVIPVYNEASIVASAADELVEGLTDRGLDFELIFAENGSLDSTPQILEAMSEKNPRIRWFHSETPNYGAALKLGIQKARGTYVICDEIDLCDLTFYDTALPLLTKQGLDMVVGSKAAKGASDRRPMVRRLATRVHNRLLRVTLGFRGTDTHGLKAFRRERLLPVIEACVVDMDVFASEFVIRAWRQGLSVTEIPIQLQEKRKPSIHLFRRVPNVLKNVVKLVYVIRVKPSSPPSPPDGRGHG
jgi:glycosyltransferase involved in cell wall biosynthesis